MLSRDNVQQIYALLTAQPRTLHDLIAYPHGFTEEQVRWAVGSLYVQRIVRPGLLLRSDPFNAERFENVTIDVKESFDSYVGIEEAK